jgi:uncharacterized protein
MRILAFSDLHCDLEAAAELVDRSGEFDVVLGAGDFASQHEGLEETVDALAAIETPTLLVPGNNETDEALRAAAADWSAAQVLHGETTELGGRSFFGLGGGIPLTPWGWSFDLDEEEAGDQLAVCPEGAVMVLHSPPLGHCDGSANGHGLGSRALADAIAAKRVPLAVCGHIHEAWGQRSQLGETRIANLGPGGAELELP